VASGDEQPSDWRDGAAYAPLLGADRSIIAWEWLRRDPSYRAAARAALAPGWDRPQGTAGPERWGLHAYEPPGRAAPCARPVWTASVHDRILKARAGAPCEGSETFELERLARVARLVPGREGREHLLLSDGLRAIRLDLVAGSLTRGPAALAFEIHGRRAAEGPLLALRRLLALWRTGRFSRTLHPREARARRWILMLRAHDAIGAGADQREIAAALFSRSAGEPRWRSREASVRSQAQRLVRGARRMAAGGYRALLRQ
jgi:hypothetical protein